MNAQFYINHLNLQPHPEGIILKKLTVPVKAFLLTLYQHASLVTEALQLLYTYLLQQEAFSAFHPIKSDECRHFLCGKTLLIHTIENDGKYCCIKLGDNINAGEVFQFVVSATAWFAAEPANKSAFTLAGCTVAPGFDFTDSEMAATNHLLDAFPQHRTIIRRL